MVGQVIGSSKQIAGSKGKNQFFLYSEHFSRGVTINWILDYSRIEIMTVQFDVRFFGFRFDFGSIFAEWYWPEYHPITSSRYYSLMQ